MAFPGLPGLRVNIEKVVFAPQLEAPPEKPFSFAYFIHIINESPETVTILARKWILSCGGCGGGGGRRES
ncbi:ApaG domain-containing protein [bacterium]|nr:ApaG domain-containing protein [bacterium]